MRLWLSKKSEVPVREQLVTQVMLGIVSGDLRPGQKLPSTRELARRFQIHSNTVSAAYRALAERGWVRFRKGSGIYVREPLGDLPIDPELELDRIIASFLDAARDKGFSIRQIQSRVRRWLEFQLPDHFLVIESDVELRNILMLEIEEATGMSVMGSAPDQIAAGERLTGAAPVALYSHEENARSVLPPDSTLLLVHSTSVPDSLKGEKQPPPDALISVASRWPEFLQWARVVLVAAGIEPPALNFRDATKAGWQRGLKASSMVITDVVTAGQMPEGIRARVFRIVAASSLAELRSYMGS